MGGCSLLSLSLRVYRGTEVWIVAAGRMERDRGIWRVTLRMGWRKDIVKGLDWNETQGFTRVPVSRRTGQVD